MANYISIKIFTEYLLLSRHLQLNTKGNIKMSVTVLALKKLIIITDQVTVIESTLKTVKEYWIRYPLLVLAKLINHAIPFCFNFSKSTSSASQGFY